MDAILELIVIGCIFAFGYILVKIRELYEEVIRYDKGNTDK